MTLIVTQARIYLRKSKIDDRERFTEYRPLDETREFRRVKLIKVHHACKHPRTQLSVAWIRFLCWNIYIIQTKTAWSDFFFTHLFANFCETASGEYRILLSFLMCREVHVNDEHFNILCIDHILSVHKEHCRFLAFSGDPLGLSKYRLRWLG